jgi:hypothetical protein
MLGRNAKPKRKDKRYTHPVLLIDPNEGERRSVRWTAEESEEAAFLREPHEGYAAGDSVICGMRFEAAQGKFFIVQGTFGERVREERPGRPPGEPLVPLTFDGHLSVAARALMARLATVEPQPPMTLSVHYYTMDWSLSGFMMGGYRGPKRQGERFGVFLRDRTGERSALFEVVARRWFPADNRLACEFVDVSEAAFQFLEEAVLNFGRK